MTPMGVPMAVPAALQARVRVLLGENKPILAIKEVRQVGKELWVRVDVTASGVGASVISTAKAEVS